MSNHHHHHHSLHAHHSHSEGLSPHRHHNHLIEPVCNTGGHADHGVVHSLDVTTTLRSELAAISYKRDRLAAELSDAKSALCAKETESESLRSQAARQSALIGSLQSRLQAAESREHGVQARCESTIQTITREKRCGDERNKELLIAVKRLESDLTTEENLKVGAKSQMQDFIRKLCACLGLDVCETLSPDCVLSKAGEVVSELMRLRAKIASTCDTLTSCESELLNLKSISNSEKQRMTMQLESVSSHNHELEGRSRQYERDLQLSRDRLSEMEICCEKLKDELRGFESRCHRLQTSMDRFQSDRLQFLQSLAAKVNVPEACETLIKDKVREIVSENQTMHTQLHSLRDQLSIEANRVKESQESSTCRIRDEQSKREALEERLEKVLADLHEVRHDHTALSEYLKRLARALCWSECTSPPAPGGDTNIMAESLLERAERLAAHHEHHGDKNCWDHHGHGQPSHGHHMHHNHVGTKLRRERSCHDIPLKESSAVYTLQRRMRVLREQVQRRDLHLELLRRKLAMLEDGARGKCVLQGERDDAVCRVRKSAKQIDKLTAQLIDARTQIAEVKSQLAEAVEYKITALERARKIDEFNAQLCELESERTRLQAQLSAMKERVKSTSESSHDRRCRDEVLINSLREDIARMQSNLSQTNHRLSNLQNFRTSVARTLHLRDLPETDLLQRLQTLCSAHQEFTLLSRRYESASPVGDHPCPRFDDTIPPTTQCRPISASSPSFGHSQQHHHQRSSSVHRHHQRSTPHHHQKHSHSNYDDILKDEGRSHRHHHFDEDLNFNKKY